MSYCYATGSVSGNGTADQFLGGLIGYGDIAALGPVIQFCHAGGNVSGTTASTYVGGFVGKLSGFTNTIPYNINHCYATGNVRGVLQLQMAVIPAAVLGTVSGARSPIAIPPAA